MNAKKAKKLRKRIASSPNVPDTEYIQDVKGTIFAAGKRGLYNALKREAK